MKTTLHIGTTKTGSKSIQTFLSSNRAVLAKQGILFPKTMGLVNQISAAIYSGGDAQNPDLARQLGITNPEEYAKFAAGLPVALGAEIAEHQPQHVIISNEHMHSRLRSDYNFKRLKQLLKLAGADGEVEVVVYLRPQVEHVISLYSTGLRHGVKETPEKFIEGWIAKPESHYFNFKVLLDMWANAFGKDNLRVRSFQAVKQAENGVVGDFVKVIGFDPVQADVRFPHVANMSMGARAARIMQTINQQEPKLAMHVRKAFLGWVRHDLRGGKIVPDIDVLRRFDALFQDTNREVIAAWLPDHPQAFDVSWDQFTNPIVEPDLTTEMILELVKKLNPSSRL